MDADEPNPYSASSIEQLPHFQFQESSASRFRSQKLELSCRLLEEHCSALDRSVSVANSLQNFTFSVKALCGISRLRIRRQAIPQHSVVKNDDMHMIKMNIVKNRALQVWKAAPNLEGLIQIFGFPAKTKLKN
ncbi:hypothetical protein SDJN02_00169 [Cucurbita argyrosperma subsp. argyrosperma]|nr:hypothetical protein SDJN02_00169 [Cucurbita argyrosperma subsp. argyrosperma]